MGFYENINEYEENLRSRNFQFTANLRNVYIKLTLGGNSIHILGGQLVFLRLENHGKPTCIGGAYSVSGLWTRTGGFEQNFAAYIIGLDL